MSYQEDSAVVISAAQLKKLGAENEKLRAERDTQVMLNNALNSQNTKLRADLTSSQASLKLAVEAIARINARAHVLKSLDLKSWTNEALAKLKESNAK